MTERTMTEPTTHTLEVPGAVLTYDIRRGGTGDAPLVLIGSLMGRPGSAPSPGTSPTARWSPTTRAAWSSRRTDGAATTTPEEHADDLSRVITAVDAGPVDLFASSGGAINALALVARHPEQVRTLIAHEPPAAALVPDREFALAACRDIHDTYQRSGMGPAMAKFIAIVSHKGPITADYLEQPAPDPAMFGLPAEDDGSRDDVLLEQNLLSCTHFEPDIDAAGRRRPASSSRPARSPTASWPTAARTPSPSGSGRRRSPSPPTTADSSVANTARRASRSRSRARLREVLADEA